MIDDLQRANRGFRQMGSAVLRFRWPVLVALLVLDAGAVVGLGHVRLNTEPEAQLPSHDATLRETKKFEQVFGNSEMIGVLVEADDVFAPRVLRLIRQLGHDLKREVPWADRVLSLTEFEVSHGTPSGVRVGKLVPDTIPDSAAALARIRRQALAKVNLVDRLFARDGRATWLTLRLRPYPEDYAERHGQSPRYAAGRKAVEVLARHASDDVRLRAVGPAIISYEESVFMARETTRLMLVALIAAIVVLLLSLRTVVGVVVPLVTAASAIVMTYGAMGLLGIEVDASFVTLPAFLGLGLSIGYSVHIITFFSQEFRRTGRRRAAILYAVQQTGWPLLFTAVTTVCSMLALNLAALPVVVWLGNASAAVVAAVFVFTVTLTPVLLSFGKDRAVFAGSARSGAAGSRAERLLVAAGGGALRHPRMVIAACAILCIGFGAGLFRLRVEVDLEKLLGPRVPYYAKIVEVARSPLGAYDGYEVVVEFAENGMAKDPRNLRRLDQLEQRLRKMPRTKRVSSLLMQIKDLYRALEGDREAYYRIPESRELIAQLLLLYESAGGNEADAWIDYDERRLRVQVATAELSGQRVVEDFEYIEASAHGIFPEARVSIVGGFAQHVVLRRYVARGQIRAFIAVVGMVGLLLVVVFRSLRAGLIALIPNIVPIVIVGGLMGYLELPIDVVTMILMPMFLGIAVDDSIHFVAHMKLEVQKTGDYDAAVISTLRSVGKALFLTTLVLVATFAVYLTSVVRFLNVLCVMTVVALTSALLADYFVMPVLIKWSKPFRRIEDRAGAKHAEQTPTDAGPSGAQQE